MVSKIQLTPTLIYGDIIIEFGSKYKYVLIANLFRSLSFLKIYFVLFDANHSS